MFHARNPADRSLDTQPKATVWYAPIAPDIEVPPKRFFRQLMLPDLRGEKLQVIFTL